MSLYQEARAALRSAGFKPRKALGQHFLVHQGVLDQILRLVDLSPADEILEIGPGLGFLTSRLVAVARQVWAIEIDPALVVWLQRQPLAGHPALKLIEGDFLKVDLDTFLPARKVKLVANLPYSVSTPILFRLFEARDHFSTLVLMVQREVAERMAASAGTKTYGALSVWCQVYGRIVDRVAVPPSAFVPRPKVRSMVLKIELYPAPRAPVEELGALRRIVRAAFGQRRKTLRNALRDLGPRPAEVGQSILSSEGIDPQRRGETLSVEEFMRLAHRLRQHEDALRSGSAF